MIIGNHISKRCGGICFFQIYVSLVEFPHCYILINNLMGIIITCDSHYGLAISDVYDHNGKSFSVLGVHQV